MGSCLTQMSDLPSRDNSIASAFPSGESASALNQPLGVPSRLYRGHAFPSRLTQKGRRDPRVLPVVYTSVPVAREREVDVEAPYPHADALHEGHRGAGHLEFVGIERHGDQFPVGRDHEQVAARHVASVDPPDQSVGRTVRQLAHHDVEVGGTLAAAARPEKDTASSGEHERPFGAHLVSLSREDVHRFDGPAAGLYPGETTVHLEVDVAVVAPVAAGGVGLVGERDRGRTVQGSDPHRRAP